MEFDIIKSFSELGITGGVLAVVLYDVFVLQKKLFNIIDNNTRAMTELKSSIETCQKIHEGDGK